MDWQGMLKLLNTSEHSPTWEIFSPEKFSDSCECYVLFESSVFGIKEL